MSRRHDIRRQAHDLGLWPDTTRAVLAATHTVFPDTIQIAERLGWPVFDGYSAETDNGRRLLSDYGTDGIWTSVVVLDDLGDYQAVLLDRGRLHDIRDAVVLRPRAKRPYVLASERLPSLSCSDRTELRRVWRRQGELAPRCVRRWPRVAG
jgi:hypothetical protein